MHFAVDVLACDLKDRKERLATSCVIVFVALDSPDGKPTAVPPWAPADDEDRRLADYAERMMELSKAMEKQVAELKAQPRARPDRPAYRIMLFFRAFAP